MRTQSKPISARRCFRILPLLATSAVLVSCSLGSGTPTLAAFPRTPEVIDSASSGLPSAIASIVRVTAQPATPSLAEASRATTVPNATPPLAPNVLSPVETPMAQTTTPTAASTTLPTIAVLRDRFPIATPLPEQACTVNNDAITRVGNVVGPDQAVVLTYSVRNPCPVSVTVLLDVRGTVGDGDARRLISDAPTVIYRNLGPGQTRALQARLPLGTQAPNLELATWTVGNQDLVCFRTFGDRCIFSEPFFISAVAELSRTDLGRELLAEGTRAGIEIRHGQPPVGVLGAYSAKERSILLDDRLDGYSSLVRAVVLAHELRHAADDANGRLGAHTTDECYRTEERAFRDQGEIWSGFWQGQLPPDITSIHAELNRITRGALRDPVAFARSVAKTYGDLCADIIRR